MERPPDISPKSRYLPRQLHVRTCVLKQQSSTSASTSTSRRPAHQSRPVPYRRLRLCAPHCHGLPDFPTSHTRQAKLDLFRRLLGQSPTNLSQSLSAFSAPRHSRKPVDDLRRSFWKPFSRQIEIEICSAGPRGLRPVPRKVHSRPVTHCQSAPSHISCPLPPESLHPSSSSSQHSRHALPAMNPPCLLRGRRCELPRGRLQLPS